MFQLIELGSSLVVQAKLPYQIVRQLPIAETATLSSGSQFVLALIVGVVMAFTFQLLFANLAIAVLASPDSPSDDSDSESLGDSVRGIETKVGLGLLVSVSIALFAASFLAVKLSLLSNHGLGAREAINQIPVAVTVHFSSRRNYSAESGTH
ncbi:hypothetical protein DO97_17095 [Neosynechococcus sphagnicola sy1]|uniref:Uncharacterized protein n=1 Tax=Neosynechococcus sphagnicola sy1 TaxID=1497020 RepID=A0A098THS7_9CYAN|nr:hypothetical protein [Neosynechococcus sphagnicola]KGF71649.1 hypothetical protein DO97_17095 [Neosynechococcus sphagnicola sy1]